MCECKETWEFLRLLVRGLLRIDYERLGLESWSLGLRHLCLGSSQVTGLGHKLVVDWKESSLR